MALGLRSLFCFISIGDCGLWNAENELGNWSDAGGGSESGDEGELESAFEQVEEESHPDSEAADGDRLGLGDRDGSDAVPGLESPQESAAASVGSGTETFTRLNAGEAEADSE